MADYFSNLLRTSTYKQSMPAKTAEAVTWYRKKASGVPTVKPETSIKKLNNQAVNTIRPGRLYLYGYDPKLKKTLPYYDMFPIVFPFAKTPNGFMGINMHYLPLSLRAKLMDSLMTLVNNDKEDETTKLRLSYDILNSAARFKYFKPCVKQYLNSHVRTRLIEITPAQWDTAIFLPLQRFVKASNEKVWKDSRAIINRN